MTVIVVIPHEADWQVSNHSFRLLADEVGRWLNEDQDRQALARGAAVGCLFFDNLGPDQARRLALAMQAGAESLRRRLLDGTDDDRSFAGYLAELSMRLTDLAGTGEP
ncbi:MAG: hypothetical protein ACJ735_08970 [Actinomycetes bacterium]